MFTFFFLVVSVLSSEALMFPKDISVLFVPQSRHLVNTTWKCPLGSEFQCCARRSWGDNVGEIQTYLILLEQCRFSLCTEVHGQPTHPHRGGGSHGVSWPFTAGSVSSSFNSSVQHLENTPEVWRSMQLIYYPCKCNTTDIQETTDILMMYHLTWTFTLTTPNIKVLFSELTH